jgi:hypothetical protein
MSPEDHLKAGVKNACLAILDDDSLDAKEKVSKLKAYIMAHAKLANMDDEGDDDGEDEEDDEEEEGEGCSTGDGMKKKDGEGMEHLSELASKDPAVKQLLEERRGLLAEKARTGRKAKGKRLCEQLRLPANLVTDVFLEQLADAKDDKAQRSLIEDRRAVAGVKRPKSAGPGTSSAAGMDVKEFGRALRR